MLLTSIRNIKWGFWLLDKAKYPKKWVNSQKKCRLLCITSPFTEISQKISFATHRILLHVWDGNLLLFLCILPVKKVCRFDYHSFVRFIGIKVGCERKITRHLKKKTKQIISVHRHFILNADEDVSEINQNERILFPNMKTEHFVIFLLGFTFSRMEAATPFCCIAPPWVTMPTISIHPHQCLTYRWDDRPPHR